MNILVTNDDGINADGLWLLAEALREVGQVTVVAPDREQSGVGTSISLAKAIRLHRQPYTMAGIEAYTVEGTPGDAVIVGLAHILKGQQVDLVVSGVNHGHNTGTEVFLSGTVGAAWHGRLRGIPAIAVSAGYKTPYQGGALYGMGARLAAVVARQIRRGYLPRDLLYNINVPFCPLEAVKGVFLARTSRGQYADEVREEDDGRGRMTYFLVFRRQQVDRRHGTEAWALDKGYMTVTLLNNELAPQARRLLPADFCRVAYDELLSRDWPAAVAAGQS